MPTHARPDRDATVAKEPARSRFIQCRLPTELYEWLRTTAFLTRRSMTGIVRETVAAYRTEVEGGRIVPERSVLEDGAQVKSSVRLDDEVYEWLRTTAFHTRTSINVLVVAALTRAHAAQTEGVPDS